MARCIPKNRARRSVRNDLKGRNIINDYNMILNLGAFRSIKKEYRAHTLNTYKIDADIMRESEGGTKAIFNEELCVAIDKLNGKKVNETKYNPKVYIEEATKRGFYKHEQAYYMAGKEDYKTLVTKTKELEKVFANSGLNITVNANPDLETAAVVDRDPVTGAITIEYNPSNVRKDSLYHEHGHILIDLMGNDSTFIQNGYEQVRGTDLWDKVANVYQDRFTENFTDDQGNVDEDAVYLALANEVLTTAIGLEANELFETKEAQGKWRFWVNMLINKLAHKLGIKSMSVAKQLAYKLVGGSIKNNLTGLVEYHEQRNMSIDDIVEISDAMSLNADESKYEYGAYQYERITNWIRETYGTPFDESSAITKYLSTKNPDSIAEQARLNISTREDAAKFFEFLRVYGIAAHAGIENYVKNKDTSNIPNAVKTIVDNAYKTYAEITVEDDNLGIAGTIDLIEVLEDGSVILHDFKTKRRGKFDNFESETFKENFRKEFANIKQSDINKYGFQLSLYKYILEQKGITVKGINVIALEGDVNLNEQGEFQFDNLEFVGNLPVTDLTAQFEQVFKTAQGTQVTANLIDSDNQVTEQITRTEEEIRQLDKLTEVVDAKAQNIARLIHDFGRRSKSKSFLKLSNNVKDKMAEDMANYVETAEVANLHAALLGSLKYDLRMLINLERKASEYINKYIVNNTHLSEVSKTEFNTFIDTVNMMRLFIDSFSTMQELEILTAHNEQTKESISEINKLISRIKNGKAGQASVVGRVDTLRNNYKELGLVFSQFILDQSTDPNFKQSAAEYMRNMKDTNGVSLMLDGMMDNVDKFSALVKKWYTSEIEDNRRDVIIPAINEFYSITANLLGINIDKEFKGKSTRTEYFKRFVDSQGRYIDEYDIDSFWKAFHKWNKDNPKTVRQLGETASSLRKRTAAHNVAQSTWFKDNTQEATANENLNILIENKYKELSTKQFDKWYSKNFKLRTINNASRSDGAKPTRKEIDLYLAKKRKVLDDVAYSFVLKEVENGKLVRFNSVGGIGVKPSTDYLNQAYLDLTAEEKQWLTYVKQLTLELISHDIDASKYEGNIPAVYLEREKTEDEEFTSIEYTDTSGQRVLNVPLRFIGLINQKPLIPIRAKYKKEDAKVYEANVIKELEQLGYGTFKDLNEVHSKNAAIAKTNKLAHEASLNHDLLETIPMMINSAKTHKAKVDMDAGIRLSLAQAKHGRTIKKNGFGFDIQDRIAQAYSDEVGLDNVEIATKATSDSNTIKRMEKDFEMVFYERFLNKGKDTNIVRKLNNYNSFRLMAFNIFAGTKNIAQGSLQTFFDATSGEYFNHNDSRKAAADYASAVMGNIAGDWRSRSTKASTKAGGIINLFDVLYHQTEVDNSASAEKGAIKGFKKALFSLGFSIMNGGEHMMQNQALLAMTHSHAIVDGKIISRHDYVNSKLITIANDNKVIRDKVAEIANITKDIKQAKKSQKSTVELDKAHSKATKELKEIKAEFFKQKKEDIKINKERRELAKKTFYTLPKVNDAIALDEEGYPQWSTAKEYKLNKGELSAFTIKVKGVLHHLHGIYNPADKGSIENNIYGQAAMKYRHWMRRGWIKRYGKGEDYYNERIGNVIAGDYKTLAKQLLKPFSKDSRNLYTDDEANFLQSSAAVLKAYADRFARSKVYWHTMSADEKAGVIRAIAELAAMGLIGLAGMALYTDDDDEEAGFFIDYANYMLDAVFAELTTWNPIGVLWEVNRLLANPAAIWGLAKVVLTLLQDIFGIAGYVFIDEDKFYNAVYYTTGANADELKIAKHAAKAVPILTQIDRVMSLHSNQSYYRTLPN